MTLTLDDTRREAADSAHRGDTVTMLQDAAGSGQPVMFPGTLESRPSGPQAVDAPAPAGGYVHGTTNPVPAQPTLIGGAMMWLTDRLIALMR